MRKSQLNPNKRRQKTMLSALFSAWGLSLLGSVPLLLLLAAIAYRSSDPRAGLSIYATVFLTALALASGFFAAKGYGKSGALIGALSGVGISVLIFGLGLSLSGTGDPLSFRLPMLALIPILGLLGGRMGTKGRVRRRRPR